jgi:LmbE family N-acetylglucosaminyl deacetylase
MNKLILAVIPHADDAAAMCGGTLAKFAGEGWRVVIARVTNDDKDSMDLPTREETEKANTDQFHHAAQILGSSEVIDLGFETDVLADTPLVQLRERIVYLYRKYQPYAVFAFDPYAPFEPNQDHVRVAQAVEEAYWVANFHLHHPAHLDQGYLPHSVCERWYYARVPFYPNYTVDITETIDQKIAALCTHKEMLRNTLHQLQLQIKTWGRRVPAIDEAICGDLQPLVQQMITQEALETARHFGLPEGRMAEVFRVSRFGVYEGFIQSQSVPLEGEAQEIFTRTCFDPETA